MSKYDVAREEAWIKEQMQLDRDREEEIRRRLKLLQDRLQNDINAQWENFAGKQKISLEEAYKLADKMDVEAFARKAKEYVKNKDFSDRANRELRLYNVKMRVSRLELLRNTIKLDVIRTFDGFDSYMGGQLTRSASVEFKRQAGILGTTLSKDYQVKAGKIVDGSFQVSPTNFPAFSDNIWQYGQELISDLDKLIVQSINQGRNPKQLSGQLRDYLVADGKANSKYKLNRLMVSEVTRVQTAVQKQSYTDADIDEYIYIFEPGACKVCLEVAKKGPYKVSEMEVGKNAPTMHPGCRCSTAAYMDREKIMADLDKRGLTERSATAISTQNSNDKISLKDILEKSNMREKVGDKNFEDFIKHLEKIDDPRIRGLFEKYGDKLVFNDIKESGGSYVRGGLIQLEKKAFSGDKISNPFETVYHEIGHAFDTLAVRDLHGKIYIPTGLEQKTKMLGKTKIVEQMATKLSGDPKYNLKSAINNDLWRFINGKELPTLSELGKKPRKKAEKEIWQAESDKIWSKWIKSKPVFLAKYKELAKDNPKVYGALSDMMESSGFFDAYPLGQGHGLSYWKSYGNEETEFFAHMTELVVNKESAKVINEIFPNAVSIWKDIVDDMLRKVD